MVGEPKELIPALGRSPPEVMKGRRQAWMPGEHPRAAVSSRKEEMVTWAGVVAVGIDWNRQL